MMLAVVSGEYIDEALLLAERGAQAVELAWRGDEKGGPPYPPAGTVRGNPKYNDGYYYIAVTYSMRLVLDKYREIAGLPASRKQKRSGCPANRY